MAVIPSSIRTNSIFGGGDPLNIQPVRSAPDAITEYAQRILPLLHGEQNRQRLLEETDRQNADIRAKAAAGNAAQHPNVVMGQYLNPNQAANIKLKQEEEQGRNDRASASLEEKKSAGASTDEVRKQRADVYQFKAMHPNLVLKEQKGGNIIAFDPITGKGLDTGFSTGTLSDQDKSDLKLTNDEKEITARGDQSRQTQDLKGNQNLSAIAARVAGTKDINAAKTATPKTQTPQQQGADYYNKANKLLNTTPAYQKYINIDPTTKSFTVDPNTPQDVYHQINSGIYGDSDNYTPGQDIELSSGNQSSGNQPASSGKDPLGIR